MAGSDERAGSPPADPATVFTSLAQLIYQDPAPLQVYQAICIAATMLIPGCDHASVLMRENNNAYVGIAGSDDIARHIDGLQKATGDGPCVDAIEDERPQIEPDLTAPQHWPRLAARVVAETPVRGMEGFRLLVSKRKVGALNLFSDTPNHFNSESADRAIVLAAFAGVAANAVVRGEQAELLHRGVRSNREIGKAVGMLMALHDVPDWKAFDMLRNISQHMNIKLADVAREVVHRRGELPSAPPQH